MSHKNTLWCCVTEPSARGKFPQYEQHVRYMVARLRSAYGRHVGDPDWEEDIRRLASMSREFADLWARHEVADSQPRTLSYLHPRAGSLSLSVSELDIPALPEARIVVYTPARRGHQVPDAPDPPHPIRRRGHVTRRTHPAPRPRDPPHPIRRRGHVTRPPQPAPTSLAYPPGSPPEPPSRRGPTQLRGAMM